MYESLNIYLGGGYLHNRRSSAVRFIGTGFIMGVLFHFSQVALSGYNGDSLGFGPYYSTYLGELAQGRYGLLIFSGRIVNPTIEFIGSIMLYAISSLLILDLINIKTNSIHALVVQAIFMSQPHLATYSTFTYASFPYTLAYFLMILSVWIIKNMLIVDSNVGNRRIYLIIVSILAVAVSFSIWQAYIPTYSVLVWMVLLLETDNKKRFHFIIMAIIVAIGGVIVYVTGMKAVNWVYDVSPTDARGFSDVLSLNLPLFSNPIATVRDCYIIFIKYLLSDEIVYNGSRLVVIHGILGLCVIATAIRWIKSKDKKDAIVTVCLLVLMPVAFCFYRVMNEDISRVPWTYLHSMIFVWILLLAMLNVVKIQSKFVQAVIILLFGYVICRQVYICNTNYSSLQERDMKSTAMAISMYTRLIEKEEWNPTIPIMVIGSMDSIYPDNNWYYETTLKGWQPQLNEFIPYPKMPQNWVVMINRIYGTQFVGIDYRWEKYDEVLNSDEYENMGIWPSNDCMHIICGVMVVKLGEV